MTLSDLARGKSKMDGDLEALNLGETTSVEPEQPWLNCNLLGMCLASLCSDLGHEMATAILPLFLVSIGSSAATLGLIEGVSDGASTLAKLGGGRAADRVGLRHRLASLGYLITGLSTGAFAAAQSWVELLIARTVGWIARGTRGPCRDNLLVDSVPLARVGTAFGFHRSADTLGAILGPLAAMALLHRLGFRGVFVLSLVPGVLSAAAFFFLVREPDHRRRERTGETHGWKAALPPAFQRFLAAVGIFGIGDFAHSMLVLRAATLMGSSAQAMSLAVMFYALHNIAHALLSWPLGALGDRFSRRYLLAAGYLVSAVAAIGFAAGPTHPLPLAVLFALEGTVMAAQETLEGAVATDLVPADVRGMGFGALHATNGVGDLVSSIVVGFIWSAFSPAAAFGYSAVLSIIGAALMARSV
jgi:MFS family permease